MTLAAMVLADRSERLTRIYDPWIEAITLGSASRARRAALSEVRPGERLLDVGCGTGTLAVAAARKGAVVVAVDRSPSMLGVARMKAAAAGVRIDFRQGDAAFPPVVGEEFDVAIVTFVLGELSADLAALAVRRIADVLRPGGRIIVADEVAPRSVPIRLLSTTARAVQGVVSFVALPQAAPARRHRWPELLAGAGFQAIAVQPRRFGSLVLVTARRPPDLPPALLPIAPLDDALPGWPLRPLLRAAAWIDLPIAVPPGVYTTGQPGPEAPVLLTGNFLASVEAVRSGLRGTGAFVAVEDTGGWNVWCAADAGLFTGEKAAALIERSGLASRVGHRTIVVPRLGGRVRRRLEVLSDWTVAIGPIESRDLPAYLATGLSPAMRDLGRMYGWRERTRVAALTVLQLPLLRVPLRLVPSTERRTIWRLVLAIGSVLPFIHDGLPGRTGIVKGATLGGIASLGGLASARIGPRGALAIALGGPLIGWIYQSSSPVIFWKRIWR